MTLSIVYYSSPGENTHRFVQKLTVPFSKIRLPLQASTPLPLVEVPYVLFSPTWGGGSAKGAVPKAVVRFLNVPANRSLCRGIVASGDRTFGAGYCKAGKVLSEKLQVPILHTFEILGTREDREIVESILISLSQKPF